MPDFEVYWRAGQRATVGEALYRADDGHYQFKYLPAFALVIAPLTQLDEQPARALWVVLSVVSLATLVLISVRLWMDGSPDLVVRGLLVGRSPGGAGSAGMRDLTESHAVPVWLVVVLTVVVLGKFFARELVLGQANAMFGVLAAGAVLAMRHRREWLAGALIALGVMFKPYGLIFVPWLFARRQLASIGALAVGLVLALALPLLRYSPIGVVELHEQWWTTVRDSTAPNLLNPDNVSWLSLFTRWFGEGSAARAAWLLTLAVMAGVLVWIWTRRSRVASPERLEGALLLMLVPLVSPQGWDYVLLLAAPAVACLIANVRELPRWGGAAVAVSMATIGLTLYDVIGRSAYHAFMMASGITLCTVVLIAALAALRIRGTA